MTSPKEPLIRIAKRNDIRLLPAILIRVAAVLLAALISLLLIRAVSDYSVGETVRYMLDGAFRNEISLNAFFKEACMLLLFALALAPVFKMRYWNIGAQGQVLIGALGSAILLFYLGNKLPDAVLLPAMILTSIVMGAFWAIIPAFFKVRFKTNETLFTLMMNYIAIQITSAFIDLWKGRNSTLGIIDRKAGSFPMLFGNRYAIVYLVTLVFVVLMAIYLTRTKHGYEIAVVGESIRTARYAGIDYKKVILRTVALSGCICGITGFLYVSALSNTISATTGGSYGFTAIIVAWLAQFNPFFMSLISLLLSFLRTGSGELVNNNTNLNSSIGDIIISVFLFFILGCEFFVRYRLIFRKHPAEEKEGQ